MWNPRAITNYNLLALRHNHCLLSPTFLLVPFPLDRPTHPVSYTDDSPSASNNDRTIPVPSRTARSPRPPRMSHLPWESPRRRFPSLVSSSHRFPSGSARIFSCSKMADASLPNYDDVPGGSTQKVKVICLGDSAVGKSK